MELREKLANLKLSLCAGCKYGEQNKECLERFNNGEAMLCDRDIDIIVAFLASEGYGKMVKYKNGIPLWFEAIK